MRSEQTMLFCVKSLAFKDSQSHNPWSQHACNMFIYPLILGILFDHGGSQNLEKDNLWDEIPKTILKRNTFVTFLLIYVLAFRIWLMSTAANRLLVHSQLTIWPIINVSGRSHSPYCSLLRWLWLLPCFKGPMAWTLRFFFNINMSSPSLPMVPK